MKSETCLAVTLVLMTPTAWALDEMAWAPGNHGAITRLLEVHGRGSKAWDPARPPYAAFDWDQTSAFLDCEEALLRFQLGNLRFKLSVDEWKTLFRDEIGGVREVTLGGKKVILAEMNADVVADYAHLQGQLAKGKRAEDLRDAPQLQDLATKVPFLYEAYGETPGIGTSYSYPWLLYLLAGHTVPGVQALTKESIEFHLGEPLRRVTWKGPRDLATKAGPVDFTFHGGLRVHPEMQDLMASLRRAGIDVYVVTASLKQVVEVFAGPGYGYGVAADHVIGMEVEVSPEGRLLPAYKEGWPRTYKQGKVDAIRSRLGTRGDPIFTAGDSDGDVAMSTAFEGTRLSLILNRVKGGEIGALCRKAVEQASSERPRFILQGRNENTGLFIPRRETIPLGETEPRLLE